MKRKKKILFVNGHLNVGGIEKSLVDLLNHLDYTSFEVDLLLLEDIGDYYHKIPSQVNIIYRNTNHVYGPILTTIINNIKHSRLSDIIFRFIIILSLYLGKNIYCLLLPLLKIRYSYDYAIAYRLGLCNEIVSYAVNSKKKICWWHNGICGYDDNNINQIKKQWQKIDTIIAVSNGCKKMIKSIFNINENKIKVIPNIIDIKKIESLVGANNPYNTQNLNIVTIGRLCWEKHIEDVPILAKKLIENGFDNFKWHIIGDGEYRDIISTAIEDNNVSEYVIMHGSQSNPYPYIKFADILMHTSHIEAQCLTLLEAMSLKTPVIATKTYLPQDFTFDGINCIICAQNHDDQISSIKKMIENLSQKKTFIENAYKTVEEMYSARIIIPIFNSIVN